MPSLTEQISQRGSIPWLYARLDGRIGRQAYWIGSLIAAAVSIVNNVLLDRIVIGYLIDLALVYVGICVTGKRFHDRGKSAWWCLIAIVPFVGWIWILIDAGILAGTQGPNGYGTEPTRTPFG